MIEKIVNGKTIGFVFDFYAFAIAEEKLNMPIDEIFASLEAEGKPKIKIIATLFYAGAVNYCELNKKPVDFVVNSVGAWMNEIGLEESMKMLTSAISVSQPKNIEPPQTEGGEPLSSGA